MLPMHPSDGFQPDRASSPPAGHPATAAACQHSRGSHWYWLLQTLKLSMHLRVIRMPGTANNKTWLCLGVHFVFRVGAGPDSDNRTQMRGR
jgi:hypothetical protein